MGVALGVGMATQAKKAATAASTTTATPAPAAAAPVACKNSSQLPGGATAGTVCTTHGVAFVAPQGAIGHTEDSNNVHTAGAAGPAWPNMVRGFTVQPCPAATGNVTVWCRNQTNAHPYVLAYPQAGVRPVHVALQPAALAALQAAAKANAALAPLLAICQAV